MAKLVARVECHFGLQVVGSGDSREVFRAWLTLLCVSSSSTDLPFKESLNCRFPDPHFNAFIDLNGDCLADVFLTCQDGESSDRLSYQIWTNDKDGQFSLARKGDLPRGTKSVGFADMG